MSAELWYGVNIGIIESSELPTWFSLAYMEGKHTGQHETLDTAIAVKLGLGVVGINDPRFDHVRSAFIEALPCWVGSYGTDTFRAWFVYAQAFTTRARVHQSEVVIHSSVHDDESSVAVLEFCNRLGFAPQGSIGWHLSADESE